MKKITKIFCLLMCLFTCQTIFAQGEAEIKAFKKNNKELLKNMKKEHNAKIDVKLKNDGGFLLVINKKNAGKLNYLLADESGSLLYPNLLDSYKEISSGHIYLGANGLFGVIDSKGKLILPIEYEHIQYLDSYDAGTYEHSSRTYWHPSSKECFVAKKTGYVLFFTPDGEISHTYKGDSSGFMSYYWKITGESGCGLFTADGEEIFPQIYKGFYFEPQTGLVNCYITDSYGATLFGAKNIKPKYSNYVVPTIFNDVRWSTNNECFEYRMHRGDKYVQYDPAKEYVLTYKDLGERYFDAGKYEKVITFYEGEGYGAAWGNYYMGLSAEKLGEAEVQKMDNCINTLNSNDKYYLPIKNPDNYKFDAGTITTMYLSAISYLEKYINCTEIPADDPTKIEARKLRGELVTKKNNISKKIDEYGTALSNATQKNIQREANIAAQQARQEAASKAIADGITNLIFGK